MLSVLIACLLSDNGDVCDVIHNAVVGIDRDSELEILVDWVVIMLNVISEFVFFFFSSRRRHTRYWRDWSSDVCSSDLLGGLTSGVVLVHRLAHQLGGGLEVDVLPVGEGIEHVLVLGEVGGYAQLLLGKVTLDDGATVRSPHAPTKRVRLLLVDALCVRVTVENPAGHGGCDLRLRVHSPFLVKVWYPLGVPAQGVRRLAVEVEGVDELGVLTMVE